jgi:hypothetical protein
MDIVTIEIAAKLGRYMNQGCDVDSGDVVIRDRAYAG